VAKPILRNWDAVGLAVRWMSDHITRNNRHDRHAYWYLLRGDDAYWCLLRGEDAYQYFPREDDNSRYRSVIWLASLVFNYV